MKTYTTITFILFYLFLAKANAQQQLLNRVHHDFISNQKGKLFSRLILVADSGITTTITLSCYRIGSTDSTLVYSKTIQNQKLTKGINTMLLSYNNTNPRTYIDPTFKEILTKYDILAPGTYITYVKRDQSEYKIFNDFDSTLTLNSPLKRMLISKLSILRKASTEKQVTNAISRLGLTYIKTVQEKITHYNLYYDNWFLGRYTIKSENTIQQEAKKEKEALLAKGNNFAQSTLENSHSLYSKFQDINKSGRKEADLNGNLTLSSNVSNQPDAFSAQNRSFYEVIGNVALPVLGIPIEVEGYYTTLDLNRKIKSSYLRAHYDVAQAKEELLTLMTNYKTQYKQVEGNAMGQTETYTGYVKKITSQQDRLTKEIVGKIAFSTGDMSAVMDTIGLFNKMLDKLQKDSTIKKENYQAKRDSLREKYQEIIKKYEQAKSAEVKVEKYQRLLEQYKNNNYLDSLMTYEKIRDLGDYENMSYKDLTKKASTILPAGKVKQLATGVTNFDLGLFSPYTSKYTQCGQQLKGISMGYDFGVATTSITTGKIEYIGRDGSVDKYSSYGLSVKLKPIKKQKIGLDYFSYSPSKKISVSDKEFFKDLSTEYPSFQKNTSIIDLNYEGELLKNILLTGNIATSMKELQGWSKSGLAANNFAYNLNAEGAIPKTNIAIKLGYESIGKNFENNTLPFNRRGTELYTARIRNSFFRNYLNLAVEYNHFSQHNLQSTSNQIKWGVDLKTQSKQYPNISISYKPFTTVRLFMDTLITPMRPMLGQIWTSKISYQYKSRGRVWRMLAIYNKTYSTQENCTYGSDLKQLNLIYSERKMSTSFSIGSMNMNSSVKENIPVWHRNKSYQSSMSCALPFGKNIQSSAGIDLSLANRIVYSRALNVSLTYRMKKLPMQFRFFTRINHYQLAETLSWQNRVSGTLDVSWQFKYKLNEKK